MLMAFDTEELFPFYLKKAEIENRYKKTALLRNAVLVLNRFNLKSAFDKLNTTPSTYF